jgi:dTDP-4-amino-4,6-dideoxygalactose transaminase
MQAGLEPVLTDICKESLSIDMAAVADRIDADTLAIICTNTGGVPDDYTAAEEFGIPVISDCAQGIGTRVGGRDLASQGTFSILSFGPTKMLTVGSGGAFLCRAESLGKAVADLATEELSVDAYRRSGFRITWGQHVGELTAGLAGAQLGRLEASVERRRQIAHSYDQVLSERSDVRLTLEGRSARLNRFRYFFLSNRASAWVEHLRAFDIDARRSISHVMAGYFGSLDAFPQLERLSTMVVSVPIYPAMTNAEVGVVAEALKLGPEGQE